MMAPREPPGLRGIPRSIQIVTIYYNINIRLDGGLRVSAPDNQLGATPRCLRGSANRLWLAARPTLPEVVNPAPSDEPSYDDDYLREGHPEVDDPSFPLRVHHTSFLWALFQELVRSTTQRFVARSGAGLPFSEIMGSRPRDISFSRVL